MMLGAMISKQTKDLVGHESMPLEQANLFRKTKVKVDVGGSLCRWQWYLSSSTGQLRPPLLRATETLSASNSDTTTGGSGVPKSGTDRLRE